MKHTIQKMNSKSSIFDENKKEIILDGYAFIDEWNHCIIIVYGDGKRDAMSKHLNSDSNELGLKYKVINLK